MPPPMQDSLPAGWLAFAGRELNPLGHDERFPSCYISSPFPGFILTLDGPEHDGRLVCAGIDRLLLVTSLVVDGREIAERGVAPARIVQRGLRTPTGPFVANFCTDIILGLAAGFAFTKRSTRPMASLSVAH